MECSLYLHIPFCTEKCDYCDFYSLPLGVLHKDEGDRFTGRYVDALLRETERRFDELRRAASPLPDGPLPDGPLPDGPLPDGPPPDGPEFSGRPALSVPTVYIGGGTPSVLGAAGMDRLLDGAAGIISAASGPPPGGPPPDASGPPPDGPPPDAGGPSEITVEANPETADPAFLRVCADRGVRRLSLGVQTFDPSLRGALGRRGCGGGEGTELLSRRLAAASEIFGEGLSLDLMSGLPGQDEGALLADIERALSHRPGHLSLYALSPEEGTPLAARNTVPGPDEADRLWLAGRDALIRAGYEHYEVSNFARPGRRCLHNIRYWRMENWIGAGSAGSGTIINEKIDEKIDGGEGAPAPGSGGPGGRRTSYAPDAGAFTEDPSRCLRTEDLERDTVLRETIMMGFRYRGGPDPALFLRRFGQTIEETIPQTLARWSAFLRPGKTALSEEGLLFLNRFTLDAFGELDASRRNGWGYP